MSLGIKKIRCNYTLDPEIIAKLKILNMNVAFNPKYSQIITEAVTELFAKYCKEEPRVKNAWDKRIKNQKRKVVYMNGEEGEEP